jgi:hypothetical protein
MYASERHLCGIIVEEVRVLHNFTSQPEALKCVSLWENRGAGVRFTSIREHRRREMVTQVVQSGAEGAPRQLFYFGFPKDRLSAWHGQEPISGVDGSFLTVRVPYSKDEFVAFQKSFKCYKTQFLPEELETIPRQLDELWGGRIYLRPWFGAVRGDDLFTLKGQ